MRIPLLIFMVNLPADNSKKCFYCAFRVSPAFPPLIAALLSLQGLKRLCDINHRERQKILIAR